MTRQFSKMAFYGIFKIELLDFFIRDDEYLSNSVKASTSKCDFPSRKKKTTASNLVASKKFVAQTPLSLDELQRNTVR
jgi:hypothetical protein